MLLKDEPRFIIVVGASAGGLNAICELVSQLKPGMNAAMLIVMHLSRKGISDFLAHRIQQCTTLHCVIATDGGVIQREHVYIAPPNFHLLIKDGKTLLGHGPSENRWRPSIDVLFRSAAANCNGRTIGIILTGLLDDGTVGMNAIKKCGGTCIVQDPNEAEYPDMPLSVLNSMEVDHCVSLAEMGTVLEELANRGEVAAVEIPPDIKAESEIAEKVSVGIDIVATLGEHSVYSCPDCGGGLWTVKDGKTDRYRCHIGHSFSERDLDVKQAEEVEATLWVAVRMMEERRNLLRKLENDTLNRGFKRLASDHEERRLELQGHIDKLKELLFTLQDNDPT